MIFQGWSVQLCNGVTHVFLQHSLRSEEISGLGAAETDGGKLLGPVQFSDRMGSAFAGGGGRDIYDIYIYISYDITQNITKDDTKMILFWMQNIETQFLTARKKP